MIRNIFSTEDVNAGQIVKEFFVYDLSANGISSSQTLLTSGGYRQNCWGFDSLQGLSLFKKHASPSDILLKYLSVFDIRFANISYLEFLIPLSHLIYLLHSSWMPPIP
ncbi:uncharacterized protein YALI1_A08759g [Yarrowia lipolytica]|uniref:Uncharacterized protein n=1 Tax=Yarrowia lipolytica TaxID=4952 RepID=A0A1D8N452_YARLL|nr:hypothetical protein YALI1_A08759g [Yarrowia lipolytica]